MVYVYFPRRKPGNSPKLTSFWRGPFKVQEKCTDFTYKVLCGTKGSGQVIHVDRMRLWRPQRLLNEPDVANEKNISNIGNDESYPSEDDDMDIDEVESGRPKRQKQTPRYLSDYVLDL